MVAQRSAFECELHVQTLKQARAASLAFWQAFASTGAERTKGRERVERLRCRGCCEPEDTGNVCKGWAKRRRSENRNGPKWATDIKPSANVSEPIHACIVDR